MDLSTLREATSAFFILVGAFVLASAALGVARFPDAFTRMHAATKAGVVGAGSMLLGSGLAIGTWPAMLSALAGIGFLVATVTLSAHALGRAAYLSGAPLAPETVSNALEHVYPRPARDALAGSGQGSPSSTQASSGR